MLDIQTKLVRCRFLAGLDSRVTLNRIQRLDIDASKGLGVHRVEGAEKPKPLLAHIVFQQESPALAECEYKASAVNRHKEGSSHARKRECLRVYVVFE